MKEKNLQKHIYEDDIIEDDRVAAICKGKKLKKQRKQNQKVAKFNKIGTNISTI